MLDLSMLDPSMFDSVNAGLLWFAAIAAVWGSALGAVAVVNARA